MVGKSTSTRTPPKTAFAARLQQAMQAAGMGQKELADRLSQRLGKRITAQRIQAMATKVNQSYLTKDVADILKVTADSLAHGPTLVFTSPSNTGYVRVEEPAAKNKPTAPTVADQLAELIHADAICPRDLQLLLSMAKTMAKHIKNGA